jgi:hypothetical protein
MTGLAGIGVVDYAKEEQHYPKLQPNKEEEHAQEH